MSLNFGSWSGDPFKLGYRSDAPQRKPNRKERRAQAAKDRLEGRKQIKLLEARRKRLWEKASQLSTDGNPEDYELK